MSLAAYHHVFQPGTSPSAPPLLLLHGTGGNELDLLPLAKKISPGSAILSPRGDVNEHGQLRFFRRFAEGVFDLDDVSRRTHALADFVTAASSHYKIDTTRLTAVGFSNGANVAATLLQLRPESLAHAILLRAMVVLNQPAAPGSLSARRILISAGAHDPIVPADQPEALATLLRAGGASVSVRVQIASHNLVPADLAAAQDFLAQAPAR